MRNNLELLKRRRRQCIVHRIIYYCFNTNIISDRQYDIWEKELRYLCSQYPHDARNIEYYWCCPSWTVGSSDIKAYPINLVRIAEDLINYERDK